MNWQEDDKWERQKRRELRIKRKNQKHKPLLVLE
jgi:hypothetical protein